MFAAALRAFRNMFSKPFRKILWKALGLTILLFALILVAVEVMIAFLATFPWPWLETVSQVLAGVGLLAAFIYLMAPVTAFMAGFYLDDIVEIVEARDYPQDPPGQPIGMGTGLITGLQFGILVLIVNLLLLPTLFFGFGAVLMIIANGYLLSREFFNMIALRHHNRKEAKALRKSRSGRLFLAGLIPALLSLIPIVNFFVPLFATAYFVHIFKRISSKKVSASAAV